MKPYQKIGWVDHVVDVVTEEVIQEGTPVSQTNMNHIARWANDKVIRSDAKIKKRDLHRGR